MSDHRLLASFLRPFLKRKKDEHFDLPGSIGDAARILAIDTGDLADLLFHIPLLSAIRQLYPGARIDFLLPEVHAPLVIPSGLARQCLIYTENQLKPWRPAFGSLLRGLGKTGYDVAFVMSLEPQPVLELAALASGASLRIGPGHGRSYPAINCEFGSTADAQRYRGDRLADLAPFLGLPTQELALAWPLPVDKLRQMAQLVHFNKPNKNELLMGVDPGIGKGGVGITVPNLVFLIKQIASQMSCRVLPLSTPEAQSRVAKFEQQIGGVPQGLARDTLLETVLLLAQCDLFLAGNTDLLHFAIAQGVPTLGLFTDADGEEWDPGPRSHVCILRLSKERKVDLATLMEAVETVTGGRARVPVAVVSPQEGSAGVVEIDPEIGPSNGPEAGSEIDAKIGYDGSGDG